MKYTNARRNALKKMIALVVFALVFALAGVACAEANPEFSKIFTDQGILHINGIFFMQDSDAYAARGDGYTECLEFGYTDDIVTAYRDTVYWDLQGHSQQDIANLDSYLRQTYASVDAMDNVSVTYTDINNSFLRHYKLVISAEKLDNPQNVRALADAGVLGVEGGYYCISMSKTDAGLLASGFIKR